MMVKASLFNLIYHPVHNTQDENVYQKTKLFE